ncbi:hypothetical protein, partial [Citrobacter farmeri]|uniref:hypothetical protein n=1 Tax=Citrobacter farmeri TaxID=67824 RepID=UPI0023313D1E
MTALTERTINHINDKFIRIAKQTYARQKQMPHFAKKTLAYQQLYYKNGRYAEIKKPPLHSEGSEFGGAKRDRTADLLHAMQALSQLSYSP